MPKIYTTNGGMAIGRTVISGTPGSVLFIGTGAVLAQDNSNFFFDDTNNYLGVGLNSSLAAAGHFRGAATTISAPTGASGAFTYDDPGAESEYFDDGYSHAIRVYSYKTVNGVKIFSSTYSQSATITDSSTSTHVYYITWSWTPAAGVDGYRIFKSDGYHGYSYDVYYETTGTSFIDGDFNQGSAASGWTSGSTATPTSSYGAAIQSDGHAYFAQTASIGINSTSYPFYIYDSNNTSSPGARIESTVTEGVGKLTLIGTGTNGRGGLFISGSHASFTGFEVGDGPAYIQMTANNTALNPLIYTIDVQTGQNVWKIDVSNNGSGGTRNGALSIKNTGLIGINTVQQNSWLHVNGTGATNTAYFRGDNGDMTIGTAGDITFSGMTTHFMAIGARTNSGTGFDLTVQGGSVLLGSTNQSGGILKLKAGICTGNGSADIEFYPNGGGASGTGTVNPTTRYGIWSTNGLNIGGNSPTARLHITLSGTTTAGTAPIKLTSGTNMTTPEAGAIEYTTDDLFFTIATGPARKGFIFNDGTKLTSGRVPFATTNGRLTDDADMTFVTDTLTVTKIASTNIAVDQTDSSSNAVSIDVQSSSASQYALNVTTNNGAINALSVRGSGNVGVGNTAPTGPTSATPKLHVSGAVSGNGLDTVIENTDAGATSFAALALKTGASSNYWQTFARNGDLFFGVANVADYVTFKSGGNVGIDTAAPNYAGYANNSKVLTVLGGSGTSSPAALELYSLGTASATTTQLGEITFGSLNGGSTSVARSIITSYLDGATNSTRLEFYTTSGGSATLQLKMDNAGDLTFTEGNNLIFGTTTGTKIGTGTTQKIGFYNSTPVVQQTDGAALTNNVTSGGTTNTIANYTDLVTYANDAAAIRNDIYQLARKLKIVDDALRTYGLLS